LGLFSEELLECFGQNFYVTEDTSERAARNVFAGVDGNNRAPPIRVVHDEMAGASLAVFAKAKLAEYFDELSVFNYG